MDDSRPSTGMEDDFGENKLDKTDKGDAADVFNLTGTTFAGATDTRPCTVATMAADTRPGTVAISRIGEEPGSEIEPYNDASLSISGRHNALLIEAELRAEHQAKARNTMLDLANALDQSNNRARELATLLRNEYDISANLRNEKEEMNVRIAALIEQDEAKAAIDLADKAMRGGNHMFFNMLLEKSGEVFDFFIFDLKRPPGSNKKPWEGKSGFGGSALGDRLQIKWALKLWQREVEISRVAKAAERAAEEARLRAEEEARKLQEAKRLAVEEMTKKLRELEQQLDKSKALTEEQRIRAVAAERELEFVKVAAAKEKEEARLREEALQEELDEQIFHLGGARKTLKLLESDYQAAQEALKEADKAFANERQSLHGVIRQVSSELHEAMVLAKHMRETALKAKRDAAGSVSPSKFAELIAQLEEMRSQLSVLSKDCNHEKDTNAWLNRQLDKNKRTLELERQFLPLLRKVRGPVGPKVKGADDAKRSKDMTQLQGQAPQNTMPPLAAGASPNKMRGSQSMGALPNGRAATAGGPLAGGMSHGGFDQSGFASSNGFGDSTRGTPVRG